MGKIIVRKQKETTISYMIPGLQRNVYSLEELLYGYISNLAYLDEQIVDGALCSWLSEQMGQAELAEKLSVSIKESGKANDFLRTLVEWVPFCTPKEKEDIGHILDSWSEQSVADRKKLRFAQLMEKGSYKDALLCGLELAEGLEGVEQAKIYHNLGVLCAKGFYFEMAAGFFAKAYAGNQLEESKELYMLSLRMSLPKQAYVERIGREDLGEELAVELENKILDLIEAEKNSKYRLLADEAKLDLENNNQGLFAEKLSKLLGEWKEKWRFS